MRSRRSALGGVKPTADTHRGLWLDRFLTEQRNADGSSSDDTKSARQNLIESCEDHPAPDGYGQAHRRWKSSFGDDATLALATARGRIALGLGQATPLEVGLTLDHTWGVPKLPGTALKGLAAAAARHLLGSPEWDVGGESYDTLFGTTEQAGVVDFMDAWWEPSDDGASTPIHLDVMTVHHGDYYARAGKTGETPPPLDTDKPNPVSFASVSGSYLVVVRGPAEWREAALALLWIGLKELGIGAKTNAGYGRMSLDASNSLIDGLRTQEEQAEKQRKEEEEERRKQIEEQLAEKAKKAEADARERQRIRDLAKLGHENCGHLMPRLLETESEELRKKVLLHARELGLEFVRGREEKGLPWAKAVMDAWPEEERPKPAPVDQELAKVQSAGEDAEELRRLKQQCMEAEGWSPDARAALLGALKKKFGGRRVNPKNKRHYTEFNDWYKSQKR